MAVAFEQLSPDQVRAVEEAVSWFHSPRKSMPFRIFGSAGTGKSTVVEHILARIDAMVQALAPTNRAAKILRGKGVEGAKTIHSVLFQPTNWCFTENHAVDIRCTHDPKEEAKHTHNVRFFKRIEPPSGVRCFTIDEASMVGAKIAEDVEMFRIPTLVVGDPYQLPPVGDQPGYTYDLHGVELEYSHRFDSESDIAYIANIIRRSDGLSEWHKLLPYVTFDEWNNYDLILAWRNATRWKIINMIRMLKGVPAEEPTVGDRLISVANTYDAGIYNADELTVCGPITQSPNLGAWNIPTEEAGMVTAWKAGFRDHKGEQWAAQQARFRGANICALTFSECMTVHKAQGGEWERVLVVDDLKSMSHNPDMTLKDLNTWAYTAVTRASKQVDFVPISDLPTGMRLRRLMREAAGV